MKSIGNLTERHVQAIWYDAAFRPNHLTTRRGSEVTVISPGEWNLGPGPDFRHAVLEIGKRHDRITGDVEVHICPSDWDRHGHGSDDAYRNVIAHVTWSGGPEPNTLPPGTVSIWLGRFVTADPTFSPDRIDVNAYPFGRSPGDAPPCELRFAGDPEGARIALASAGTVRLRTKARRIAGRLSAADTDRHQVFYEEVMTALGYRWNQSQFLRVARRVPIADLPSDIATAESAMVAAGSFEDWERVGRPWNNPERRLRCAAHLFAENGTMELCDASDFGRDSCAAMVRRMCRDGAVGKGRAAAIVANVVLPFALAEGRSDVPDWLPPEDVSEPVRRASFRLFGRDHNPARMYAGNGLLIQGLLHVYRDYCEPTHPDCNRCRFVA